MGILVECTVMYLQPCVVHYDLCEHPCRVYCDVCVCAALYRMSIYVSILVHCPVICVCSLVQRIMIYVSILVRCTVMCVCTALNSVL